MRGERERGGREEGERERERERRAVRTFRAISDAISQFSHVRSAFGARTYPYVLCVPVLAVPCPGLLCTLTFSGLGQPIPTCTEHLR